MLNDFISHLSGLLKVLIIAGRGQKQSRGGWQRMGITEDRKESDVLRVNGKYYAGLQLNRIPVVNIRTLPLPHAIEPLIVGGALVQSTY